MAKAWDQGSTTLCTVPDIQWYISIEAFSSSVLLLRVILKPNLRKNQPHSNRDACIHTRPCVACADVLAVYVWCYQHTTLSTFACRAGPFSCRLTLAKSEKKSAPFKQRRAHTYAAVRGLCGCSGGLCVVLPACHPVHFCLPSRPL